MEVWRNFAALFADHILEPAQPLKGRVNIQIDEILESVAEFGNMRHEKKEKVDFSASTVS